MTGRDLHVEDNSKDSLEVALQSLSKDEIISTCIERTGEAASHFLTKIKAVKTAFSVTCTLMKSMLNRP